MVSKWPKVCPQGIQKLARSICSFLELVGIFTPKETSSKVLLRWWQACIKCHLFLEKEENQNVFTEHIHPEVHVHSQHARPHSTPKVGKAMLAYN